MKDLLKTLVILFGGMAFLYVWTWAEVLLIPILTLWILGKSLYQALY